MNVGVTQISKEEFNNNIKIRFKNILDGFSKYSYKTLKGNDKYSFKKNEHLFIDFIEEVYKLNTIEGIKNSCYIDFYLKDLNEEEYNTLLEGLDISDRESLDYVRNSCTINTEYFEVNDISIISTLTKMCTRELFFITFYFTKLPVTIWGNYNLSFPMFYEDEDIIGAYRDIIEKYELDIK